MSAGVEDQPLEVELRDRRQRRQIVSARHVDDGEERALAVEVPEHVVDLVGDLREPLDELPLIDLEDAVERRELLEHPPPLVEPPHPLHEDALRREVDALVAPHRAKVDLEGAVVEDERAIHGALTDDAAHLGVDDLAFAEEDLAARAPALEVQHAALAGDVDRLEQIDEPHVRERAAEARLRERVLQALALLPLQHQVHAGDDLFDVDRLGEVVLDAELQPADLALDRGIARQEDERDRREVRALLDPLDEREPIPAGQARVRQDQVGQRQRHHVERALRVGRGRDAVARFAQADLEHAQAPGVGIDEQ